MQVGNNIFQVGIVILVNLKIKKQLSWTIINDVQIFIIVCYMYKKDCQKVLFRSFLKDIVYPLCMCRYQIKTNCINEMYIYYNGIGKKIVIEITLFFYTINYEIAKKSCTVFCISLVTILIQNQYLKCR